MIEVRVRVRVACKLAEQTTTYGSDSPVEMSTLIYSRSLHSTRLIQLYVIVVVSPHALSLPQDHRPSRQAHQAAPRVRSELCLPPVGPAERPPRPKETSGTRPDENFETSPDYVAWLTFRSLVVVLRQPAPSVAYAW